MINERQAMNVSAVRVIAISSLFPLVATFFAYMTWLYEGVDSEYLFLSDAVINAYKYFIAPVGMVTLLMILLGIHRKVFRLPWRITAAFGMYMLIGGLCSILWPIFVYMENTNTHRDLLMDYIRYELKSFTSEACLVTHFILLATGFFCGIFVLVPQNRHTKGKPARPDSQSLGEDDRQPEL
jgi:hypothetical protein